VSLRRGHHNRWNIVVELIEGASTQP
jgi:hypothetical protein